MFPPEHQAARWVIRKQMPVRFIDLPVTWLMSVPVTIIDEDDGASDETGDAAAPEEMAERRPAVERDPIGTLAHAAGYENGESCLRGVIEENPEPGPIFAAVADAMAVCAKGWTRRSGSKPRAKHICGWKSPSPARPGKVLSPSYAGRGTCQR